MWTEYTCTHVLGHNTCMCVDIAVTIMLKMSAAATSEDHAHDFYDYVHVKILLS